MHGSLGHTTPHIGVLTHVEVCDMCTGKRENGTKFNQSGFDEKPNSD